MKHGTDKYCTGETGRITFAHRVQVIMMIAMFIVVPHTVQGHELSTPHAKCPRVRDGGSCFVKLIWKSDTRGNYCIISSRSNTIQREVVRCWERKKAAKVIDESSTTGFILYSLVRKESLRSAEAPEILASVEVEVLEAVYPKLERRVRFFGVIR